MRLHVIALPDAMHPHARNVQVPGELAHAPVGRIGRPRFQRGIQDLLLQLRGERAWRPLALAGLAEGLAAPAAEGGTGGQNRGARESGLLCNRVIGNPLAGQQNRLTLPSHPLRGSAGPSPGLQLSLLRFVDH